MQTCRDCHCRRRNSRSHLRCRAFASRFQQSLCHLLHEQRDTIGALDNILPDVCWNNLIANEAINHGTDFTLSQPIEGEGGHMRPSDPWRLELWSRCHDQQDTETWYPADGAIKQFKTRRVAPMGVFEDHQDRILP